MTAVLRPDPHEAVPYCSRCGLRIGAVRRSKLRGQLVVAAVDAQLHAQQCPSRPSRPVA